MTPQDHQQLEYTARTNAAVRKLIDEVKRLRELVARTGAGR